MNDVYVYEVALPNTVKGVTVTKGDDTIILINSNLCDDIKDRTLRHELMHVTSNHLYSSVSVKSCENQASNIDNHIQLL